MSRSESFNSKVLEWTQTYTEPVVLLGMGTHSNYFGEGQELGDMVSVEHESVMGCGAEPPVGSRGRAPD